jgi:cytoskeletal protein CcmA (bactofilin family)
MGLKENFNQALREMLNKGGLVGSDLENKAKTQSDLNSYLETPADSPAAASPAPAAAGSTSDRAAADMNVRVSQTDWSEPPNFVDQTGSAPYQTVRRPDPQARDYDSFRQNDEMTVISKNTLIVGDIRTLANITIDGNVNGKVEALRDATLRGMIVGDVTCGNTDIKGSSIQGNIFVKGSAYIDNDSILLGDLTSQYASIDGKVKGNLDVGSKVEIRSNAIIAGNINTNSITVMDGANIRGYVNTTFLKEHGDSAFPKQIVINTDNSEQQ